jgi:hypothetical protein
MVPLTVDGLIYASSMVMLESEPRKKPVPALGRWLLGLGIAARLRPRARLSARSVHNSTSASHLVAGRKPDWGLAVLWILR